MKHCIGIIEVLVKTVIVESNDTSAGSLQKVIDCVKREYNAQKIVLCADDLRPNSIKGEPAFIDEADWINPEEVQKRKPISLYEKGFLFAIIGFLYFCYCKTRAVSTEQRERARQMMIERNKGKEYKGFFMEI